MTGLSLDLASTIVDAALAAGVEHRFMPLCVVVLDAGGHMLVMKRSERASLYRREIATAKAMGCLGMGFGGRALAKRAKTMPEFYATIGELVGQPLVGVPGGILIRNEAGDIIGAVGISGDTSENDETCGLVGIAAAKLKADTGE